MLKMKILVAGLSLATFSPAIATTINFDVNQASYIAPTSPGATALVRDQFASIGVLFRDLSNTAGSMVAVTGGFCGLCSPPVVLAGAGQNTQFIFETIFVDPTNINNPGYVTQLSGLFTDASQGTPAMAQAFDVNGNLLGTVFGTASNNSSDLLSLSGIGQIHSVRWTPGNFGGGLDPTTFDNLTFNTVQAVEVGATPLPAALPLFATGLAGLCFVAHRRKRKQVA